MWMACYTDEDAAHVVDLERSTVTKRIDDLVKKVLEYQIHKTMAFHQEESFKPPLYNVWNFHQNTSDIEHPGNSEPTIIDWLLYLYTEPFNIVVDPFAGSGSTIDICKNRYRRYWVGDRKPIIEREDEIRVHDITDGLPDLKGRWKDVKLVYLDPPYWKQAKGFYGDDPTNLANMDLDTFNKTLSSIINGFAKQLLLGAHIALLIQPTQWNAPDRKIVDHVIDMIKLVKAQLERRISCPYSTQQYSTQMVEWAKEHKECLVLTRELVVWQV
jgi:DNA modification methylase